MGRDGDQSAPLIQLTYEDIDPARQGLADLVDQFGRQALEGLATRLTASMRPRRFWKPRRLVGGASIQQEEIGHNTFGATLSADFAHIFNPVTLEDRTNIAVNGYIPSRRRERYVEPIDRVIRASTANSEARAKLIEDTQKPTEIVKAFRTNRPLEHQVLLIIGSAGSGKTTFIDHLKAVALPDDLKVRTIWANLNMNVAPVSSEEIYSWTRKQIISGCKVLIQRLILMNWRPSS